MVSSEPEKAAQWRGVDKRLSVELMSKPYLRKKAKLIGWSPYAATWSILIPMRLTAFMFAPCLMSNFIMLKFPWKDA